MIDRKKLLLIGLIATVVLWQGGPIVSHYLLSPITSREQRIRELNASILQKRATLAEHDVAMARMKDYGLRSLPSNPSTASTLYQNWLTSTAQKAGWKGVEVVPGRVDSKPKGNTYYSLAATVKGTANLKDLAEFLHNFEKSGLLHRVAWITLQGSEPTAKSRLDVSLQVEALSLVTSSDRNVLVAEKHPGTPMNPLADRSQLKDGLKLNPFVRGYNGPPKPPAPPPVARVEPKPAPPPPPDPFDLAEHVVLVGSLSVEGKKDAYLFDRINNRETVLKEGSKFEVGKLQGEVTTIERDRVIIRVQDQLLTLELGKSLRQMMANPGPGVSVSTPPAPTTAPPTPPAGAAESATDSTEKPTEKGTGKPDDDKPADETPKTRRSEKTKSDDQPTGS